MNEGPSELHWSDRWSRETEAELASTQGGDRRCGYTIDEKIGCLHARHRFTEEDGDRIQRSHCGSRSGKQSVQGRRCVIHQPVGPPSVACDGRVEAVGRLGLIHQSESGIPLDGDRAVGRLGEFETVRGRSGGRDRLGSEAVDEQVRGHHSGDRLTEGYCQCGERLDRGTGDGIHAEHRRCQRVFLDGLQRGIKAQITAAEAALKNLD